ncbi:PrsW family intramembrane metalloprotease [Candidatus Peregrinibacteria bacterium]|nr:PrsW family intramembrane metalloprotease [Candidatus Peregrinibacteria bacterium]
MIFEIKYIVVFLITIIPFAVWLYLFLWKRNLNKFVTAAVFAGGMIAAKLILIYQDYWEKTINLIFFKVNPVNFRENIQLIFSSRPILALFLSFIGVGVMEEFLKFLMLKTIGHRFFKSIDDVIEMAIITALGFAFFENIVYFFNQWGQLSTGTFMVFAIFRITIVTMVHILCSGVLGYYFGMAFFASPVLKIEYLKKKKHPVLGFFSTILHLKKENVYHDEMLLIGLVSALSLHAIYDFVLSMEFVVLGLPLHIPIMLLYFFGGFWYLNHLLKKKELNINLGLIGDKPVSREEFIKMIESE